MKSALVLVFLVFALGVLASLECDLKTGVCSDPLQIRENKMFPHNIPVPKSSLRTKLPNPPVSDFVKKLVASLSLREKIGQMTQLDVSTLINQTALAQGHVLLNKTALEYGIKNYGVGSYLNSPFASGPVGGISGFNVTGWATFMTELKQLAKQYSNSSLPIIYGLDSVHGANYVYNATMFPHNLGTAATFNVTNAYEGPGRIAARDTRAAGISWIFAPVVGIGVNPLWPRIYETFGEDPYLAGEMATNVVHGIEGTGNDVNSQYNCACTIKHYLGYPDPKSGKDRTVAWMGQRQLLRYFLPPFAETMSQNPRSLMINSGSINNIPVHSSYEILTTLLREELQFEGVAVTDYQDIEKLVFFHRLVETYSEATLLAVNAGIDMSMVPLDFSFSEDLYHLVLSGKVSEGRIDKSVTRILQLKEQLGLFGPNYLPSMNETELAQVGSAEDWELSLQVARESITLLKNSESLLPLDRNQYKNILVTGPAGNSVGVQSGGWSIHWQGAADYEFAVGVSIFEGIQKEAAAGAKVTFNQGVTFENVTNIASVVADAQSADVIILCLGEEPESEAEGDINDLVLSAPQLELYEALKGLKKPIVLALVEARPRILGPVADADAIFMCYLPGPMGGQAFADLLFGSYSPSGRLPITYPQYTGDIGVNYYHLYSDTTTPLYPFGTGLSYTTFQYTNLQFPSTWDANSGSNFTVSITVTNVGSMSAADSVLLYVSDLFCNVSPEVKMLRRFTKIYLTPNQKTTLQFTLTLDDLSFINRNLRSAIETGIFTISIGDQSRDFVLTV